jgi:hypothetical protein
MARGKRRSGSAGGNDMPFTAAGLESAVSGTLQAGGGKSKIKNMVEDEDIPLKSYHRGGKVRKTGPARLKKGEVVLTKKQAKKRVQKRGRK